MGFVGATMRSCGSMAADTLNNSTGVKYSMTIIEIKCEFLQFFL